MDVLPRYEAMAGVSRAMVEAARANEWDRLVALGAELARLRNELARGGPRSNAAATEAESSRQAALIRSMLDDDREVRRHVEPWLESTRKLLSGTVRDRNVRAAYGAG